MEMMKQNMANHSVHPNNAGLGSEHKKIYLREQSNLDLDIAKHYALNCYFALTLSIFWANQTNLQFISKFY